MNSDTWQTPEFWYLLLLLVILLGTIAWRMPQKTQWTRNLKGLLVWSGIIGVLMVIYVLRHELSEVPERLATEFLGAEGLEQDEGMRFRLDKNGHANIKALVNDQAVVFLLDTGASRVVIGANDSRRLGFVPNVENAVQVNTANGKSTMYRKRLSSLKIGSKILYDIPALLNPLPDSVSLLGMTAISHLKLSINGDYVFLK